MGNIPISTDRECTTYSKQIGYDSRNKIKSRIKTNAHREENSWRNFGEDGEWTVKYRNMLLKDIDDATERTEKINILLIGPISSGKSSFLNTVASIDKGRVAQVTMTGEHDRIITKKLFRYTSRGDIKGIRIFDTMGLAVTDLNGLNIKDLLYIVNGNVKPHYKFNSDSPITVNSVEFNTEPTDRERMHCVVFVMDANEVGHDNIPDTLRKKIKVLLEELNSYDIPRIVLLTKLDTLCEVVENDITQTYTSEIVKEAVEIATDLFYIPKSNIFPVQNYEEEIETDFKKEILILLALRQMVFFAHEYMEEI